MPWACPLRAAQSDDGSDCYSLRAETGCADGRVRCLLPCLGHVLVHFRGDVGAHRETLLLEEAHHGRRDEIVEPHDRVGIVAEVLMGEIGHFLVFDGSAVVCSMT